MELKGKIKAINDLSTDKIVKKQMVIEVENGKYKNNVAIDFLNDKAKLLDPMFIEDTVEVSFNIVSREHQGKWYTNLNAWSIKS